MQSGPVRVGLGSGSGLGRFFDVDEDRSSTYLLSSSWCLVVLVDVCPSRISIPSRQPSACSEMPVHALYYMFIRLRMHAAHCEQKQALGDTPHYHHTCVHSLALEGTQAVATIRAVPGRRGFHAV
jgi:hypothetical protein